MSVRIDLNPTPELKEFISLAIREAIQKEIQPLVKKSRNKLTRSDVARKLNVSLPTIDKYSNDGILKKYKQGGRYFFYEDEVENAYIEMEARK